jgi:hypothetical protein
MKYNSGERDSGGGGRRGRGRTKRRREKGRRRGRERPRDGKAEKIRIIKKGKVTVIGDGADFGIFFPRFYPEIIFVPSVLDLVSQVRNVVLGNPRGSGFWNGEYMGKGMEMGRSVYEQPGTEVDRILSQ